MISNIHVKQDFCLFADTNIHTLSRCWDLEAKCHLIHFSCLPLLLFPSRGVICPEHELKLGLMLHTPCFIYVSYSRKVLVSLSSSTCIYRAPSQTRLCGGSCMPVTGYPSLHCTSLPLLQCTTQYLVFTSTIHLSPGIQGHFKEPFIISSNLNCQYRTKPMQSQTVCDFSSFNFHKTLNHLHGYDSFDHSH